MLVLGSILLALFGIQLSQCGVTALKNRPKWLLMAANYTGANQRVFAKVFGYGLMSAWLAQGASMLVASVLLWFNLRTALILGLWPAAFWLIVVILPKRKNKPEHESSS